MVRANPAGSDKTLKLANIPPKPVYKVRDLAILLGCSSRWVTRLIRQGRIEAFQPLGGHWRIPPSEVERLQREGVPPHPRRVPVENRLYRVREVAVMFGCSSRWITELINQRRIRAGRFFGGHWRIHPMEVERLRKTGMPPPVEEPWWGKW